MVPLRVGGRVRIIKGGRIIANRFLGVRKPLIFIRIPLIFIRKPLIFNRKPSIFIRKPLIFKRKPLIFNRKPLISLIFKLIEFKYTVYYLDSRNHLILGDPLGIKRQHNFK